MIEEKDIILRETQRLTLLLKELISIVTDLDSGNTAIGINETDQTLKNEFDLSLKEISTMSNDDFSLRIKEMNETHIDNLIKLIFELIKKAKESNNSSFLNQTELVKKNILMIEMLDGISKLFSLERMNMRNQLQRWL